MKKILIGLVGLALVGLMVSPAWAAKNSAEKKEAVRAVVVRAPDLVCPRFGDLNSEEVGEINLILAEEGMIVLSEELRKTAKDMCCRYLDQASRVTSHHFD